MQYLYRFCSVAAKLIPSIPQGTTSVSISMVKIPFICKVITNIFISPFIAHGSHLFIFTEQPNSLFTAIWHQLRTNFFRELSRRIIEK